MSTYRVVVVHLGTLDMKFSLLIIFGLFVFLKVNGQDNFKKEQKYKPINLKEAVEQLKLLQHDTTKQEILMMTEEEHIWGLECG